MRRSFYRHLIEWFAARGLGFSAHRSELRAATSGVGLGAYFFTQPELSLWRSVQEAAGPQYQVFAKVPFVELAHRLPGPRASADLMPTSLQGLLLDAVVCVRWSGEIVALVQTESMTKRVPLDFVETCRRNRVPLVVLRQSGKYLPEDLREELRSAVARKGMQ